MKSHSWMHQADPTRILSPLQAAVYNINTRLFVVITGQPQTKNRAKIVYKSALSRVYFKTGFAATRGRY